MSTVKIVADLIRPHVSNINRFETGDIGRFKVKRTKSLTDKRILTIDAKIRGIGEGITTNYQPPERTIENYDLEEFVKPRILAQAKAIGTLATNLEQTQQLRLGGFMAAIPYLEFYCRILDAFNTLVEKRACFVKDNINDPYTSFFIIGKDSASEIIYLYTLLRDF